MLKKEKKRKFGASWIFGICLSLLITISLAPLSVWISIEKNELLYLARKKQTELDKKIELTAKLEVEYTRLHTPYELEQKAIEIGMGVAKSGQVRRLEVKNSVEK